MQIDSIVAGTGGRGCTVARRLAELGCMVLVLKKRGVVGRICGTRSMQRQALKSTEVRI